MENRSPAADHSPFDLMPGAFAVFGSLVPAVAADAWDNATPCTEWSVRDLVNHMVSEHLWAPRLLAGESIEDVGDAFDGDVIGPLFEGDPMAAWSAVSSESRNAFAAVDDPDLRVHVSSGPTPARKYAAEMLMDLVVHGWDLARGAGLDEHGDPQAVAYVLASIEANRDSWLGSGVFAPPVETDSTDPLVRLVALLGRRP